MPQPWLETIKRRTLEDIKERLGIQQIYGLITCEVRALRTRIFQRK